MNHTPNSKRWDAYLPKVGLAAELLEVVRTVLARESHHAGRGTPASID